MEDAGNPSPNRGQIAAPTFICSGSAVDLCPDVGEAAVSQISSVPRASGPRRPFSPPAHRDHRSLLPVASNPNLRDREDGATATPAPQQPSAPVMRSKRGRETGESQKKATGLEMKMVTEDGSPIDFTALQKGGDEVYEGELSRRTAGMESKEQILEFMERLDVEWLNQRHTRVCVDARKLADVLPAGWKVIVALRRRRSSGHTVPYISRYISPSGEDFPSCKKVARFLKSQSLSMAANQNNVRVFREEHGDAANCTAIVPYQAVVDVAPIGEEDDGINCTEIGAYQDGAALLEKEEEDNGFSRAIVPYAAPESHGKEIGSSEEGTDDLVDVQIQGQYDCDACNMRFNEFTEYAQHRKFHLNTPAGRRKRPRLTDGVIMKDGKYGCQFCSKVFDRKISYSGHIGIHFRRSVQSSAAANMVMTQEQNASMEVASMAAIPYQGMDPSIGHRDEEDELANLRLLSEVSTRLCEFPF